MDENDPIERLQLQEKMVVLTADIDILQNNSKVV